MTYTAKSISNDTQHFCFQVENIYAQVSSFFDTYEEAQYTTTSIHSVSTNAS